MSKTPPPMMLSPKDLSELITKAIDARLATVAKPDAASNFCRSKWADGKCDRKAVSKGLCWSHYYRAQRLRKDGAAEPEVEKAINAPIRSRAQKEDDKLVMITRTAVPKEVADNLKVCAKANDQSEYEFLKELLVTWHESRVKMGLVVAPKGRPKKDKDEDTQSAH